MASDDQADTAAKPKPKPSGRKAKKLSQQEQSDWFIETARTLEADESGEKFDSVMRAILDKSDEQNNK